VVRMTRYLIPNSHLSYIGASTW